MGGVNHKVLGESLGNYESTLKQCTAWFCVAVENVNHFLLTVHVSSACRLRLLRPGLRQLLHHSLLPGQRRTSHDAPCWQRHGDAAVLRLQGHTPGAAVLQRDRLRPPETRVCRPAHAGPVHTGVCDINRRQKWSRSIDTRV